MEVSTHSQKLIWSCFQAVLQVKLYKTLPRLNDIDKLSYKNKNKTQYNSIIFYKNENWSISGEKTFSLSELKLV